MVEVHPNIYEVVDAIDVHIWGHGTTRPTLGVHPDEELSIRQQAVGRAQLAHSDLSGVSLFEGQPTMGYGQRSHSQQHSK